MSYFLEHPYEAVLLLLNGITSVTAIGLIQNSFVAAGVACAAVSCVVLGFAIKTMLRGSADWGSVPLSSRQRSYAFLAAIGFLVAGVVAIWFGFDARPLAGQVGLIAGGTILFLCGVVAFAIWLYVWSDRASTP